MPVSYTHLDVYKRQVWEQKIVNVEQIDARICVTANLQVGNQ